MKRNFLLILGIVLCSSSIAQKKDAYVEQIKAYQHSYVKNHEVVTKKDKRYFHFFPINPAYNVTCYFERITDTVGFTMNTSANTLSIITNMAG